ncbi:MAG TPA: pitrilysin family protein [Bacteroidales bacterium]|nr:pitrilysin family protein [Bacteroidales bacterium]HPT02221.1 pitrilysin family protein [Bacteroidales bacterium]
MIQFDRFTLLNGLRVIVHHDASTPIVAMNILYNVGSRDEDPNRTGFAHLFEHLMFGGSVNIPRFDEPLERVGGENNAFTNCDFTNYYLTIPKPNLETAFWLESDRMLDLAFSAKSLDVQRNVVAEEFRQNYLNQPYGDTWLLLRPLAYKIHPYRWPTIGKELSHIENAGMDEVKTFYRKFYNPSNAILVVAGDVETEQIRELSEKWFGEIRKNGHYERSLPVEPEQEEDRFLEVERKVPYDSICKVWHMCRRNNPSFYATDLISDVMSAGQSGRLYAELVKKQQLFSELNAYITGDIDEGLFVISGKLIRGITFDQAEKAIESEIRKICSIPVEATELQKLKNRAETLMAFSEMRVLDKAMNLAYYEFLGDAALINRIIGLYNAVESRDIQTEAMRVFRPGNCSTLHYKAV